MPQRRGNAAESHSQSFEPRSGNAACMVIWSGIAAAHLSRCGVAAAIFIDVTFFDANFKIETHAFL